MNFTLKIIFGEDQINKFFSGIPFSGEDFELNIKEYSFETEIELKAFKKGVSETIGWMECHILEKYAFTIDT